LYSKIRYCPTKIHYIYSSPYYGLPVSFKSIYSGSPRSLDVASKKTIALYEFSKIHFQGFEAMGCKMHPEYPGFLNQLAEAYSLMGNFAEAIKTYEEDLEIVKKFEGTQSEDYQYLQKKIKEVTELSGKSN